jgi:hypothetical protein
MTRIHDWRRGCGAIGALNFSNASFSGQLSFTPSPRVLGSSNTMAPRTPPQGQNVATSHPAARRWASWAAPDTV